MSIAPGERSTRAAGVREGGTPRRLLDGARLALSFLTVLPVGAPARADMRAAAGWFPVVGALVGVAAGGVRVLAEGGLGATAASVLAAIVVAVLTGALHLDGLADCADGIGARGDRDRRLAVMRDSAIGAFGTLALVFWTLGLVAVLARLDSDAVIPALVVACCTGRWAALAHAAATGPARRDGLGAHFEVPGTALVAATAAAGAACFALLHPIVAATALVTAALVSFAMSRWAAGMLGGRTGDTLGATVALSELAVLTAVLAWR